MNKKNLIIVYHGIEPDYGPRFTYSKCVKSSSFEKQIIQLSNHYKLISLEDYIHMVIKKTHMTGNYCVITFDDGLRGCYDYALPILQKLGVQSTFFICSEPLEEQNILAIYKINLLIENLGSEFFLAQVNHHIEQIDEYFEYEDPASIGITNIYRYDDDARKILKKKLNYELPIKIKNKIVSDIYNEFENVNFPGLKDIFINQEEIKKIHNYGHSIGAHTHSHEILARISDTAQHEEIHRSVDFLSQIIGQKVTSFAYPFGTDGTYTDLSKLILSKSGMKFALNVRRKQINLNQDNDLYDINRYDVSDVFDCDNKIRKEFKVK